MNPTANAPTVFSNRGQGGIKVNYTWESSLYTQQLLANILWQNRNSKLFTYEFRLINLALDFPLPENAVSSKS